MGQSLREEKRREEKRKIKIEVSGFCYIS